MSKTISSPWHLEEYMDDPDRVRVVSSTGASDWFSRLRHTDDTRTLVVPSRYILEALKEEHHA